MTGRGCCTALLYGASRRPVPNPDPACDLGALGGTRTPNLLIRSQMLYPLSYERSPLGCLPAVLQVSATIPYKHSGIRASDLSP